MIDIAIIASALPVRAPLLERSLHTWDKSAKASGLNYQICVFSEDWDATSLCWRYDNCRHASGKRSGSHIYGYNFWTERVEAKVYLYTHPDMLFPLDTVLTAYTLAVPNRFVGFKVYWIPEDMTQDLDMFPWQQPEQLENFPAMFPLYFSDGHGDFYFNGDVRDKMEWHSTTTFAIDYELAHKIYPMPNLGHQGYDDPLHYAVRRLLNVEDFCVQDPILMHQHHPQTWNGNSQEAVQEATELLNSHYKPKFGIK